MVKLALLAAAISLLGACDSPSQPPLERLLEALSPARYLGAPACARCHPAETERWKGSDHELAMKPATPEWVLGDFDDASFTYFGVTSRMFRKGDRYFITTDGPQGKLETYRVSYTFGVRPLQQYMVEFEDGRVQVLPIAWDTEGKRWFHLYPDEKVDHESPLHWTKSAQTWNYECADCHSTNLRKNYDPKTDTYRTTYSEMNVSCEACHGPGSIHVELAEVGKLGRDERGSGLVPLGGPDPRVEIETCAPCHSRRWPIYPGFRPGMRYLDYYLPSLFDGDLYFPDGQILEEVYDYGSFLQSKMYRAGVRCTDCHDPHSAGLRRAGNKLCTSCHEAESHESFEHHRHKLRKRGRFEEKGKFICVQCHCIECHMPERTYMGVDPRRDHSMRIPRPDLSVRLGTPNPCNGCHRDKSAEWAAEKTLAWYGAERAEGPHYGVAMEAGRRGDPQGEKDLLELVSRQEEGPMIRATALSLLGRYASEDARRASRQALSDPDALVRYVAVRNVERYFLPDLVDLLAPLLGDSVRLVRTEAVRALAPAYRVLSKADSAAFDRAASEYEERELMANDQAESYHNLGIFYANLGSYGRAESSYRMALKLNGDFYPAAINLATLYGRLGRRDEAERTLREVIEKHPDVAEGHYNLALLLAEEEGRLGEAAEELRAAARLDPSEVRIKYNLGLALERLGRYGEAENTLLEATRLAPDDTDVLYALGALYAASGRWGEALSLAERLVRLDPSDSRARGLLALARRNTQ